MFQHIPVLIKGAGDLASGVAVRLHRSGFPVVMTELAHPLTVRRSVAFAEAVFAGETRVEEVQARCCLPADIKSVWAAGAIPVVVDPEAQMRAAAKPVIVVDAIMAKRNLGTRLSDARLVVALGPGFSAGQDCHVVIETQRGHNLGRALWQGSAEPDTGQPGTLPGMSPNLSRVLRAPQAGHVLAHFAIGDRVPSGAIIASVRGADRTRPVVAPFAGVLRGLIHADVPVVSSMKIGDLDPRARRDYCFTVSDKSLAIGGGVLEAILGFLRSALPPAAKPAPPAPRRRRRG
jgi:xanthine dehydrogenase accessory factor